MTVLKYTSPYTHYDEWISNGFGIRNWDDRSSQHVRFHMLTTSFLVRSYYTQERKRDSIVTIRADFQQSMESVSLVKFKMNTVTENYWVSYAAATVISHYHVGMCFPVAVEDYLDKYT